jgi:hypothetical protein
MIVDYSALFTAIQSYKVQTSESNKSLFATPTYGVCDKQWRIANYGMKASNVEAQ